MQPPFATQKEVNYTVGGLLDGKLVIAVISRGSKNVPVILEDDYAAMLINEGDAKNPKVKYVLAVAKKKKVVSFTDVRQFKLSADIEVPKTFELRPYDACTTSLNSGLSETEKEEFEKVLKKHSTAKPSPTHITCSCESVG